MIGNAFAATLRQHCGGRLLDLGCGYVPYYEVYKPLIVDNVYVDWPSSLHQNEFLDHQCDITKPLPLASESFDTIILTEVMEHIAEPWNTWTEISRLLRPGGKVLVSVPFVYILHEEPHDYYRYTKFALQRFVENAGLTVLSISNVGGLPEIFADLIAKESLRLGRFGRWLCMFVQWACWRFVNTKLGRKVSEATGDQCPFFYVVVATK